MPNPEIKNAKDIYLWLWIAPLLLLFFAPFAYGFVSMLIPRNVNWVWSLAGTALVLGFVHLWLLLPAIVAKSEFVSWHAWQALLIAGVQSLILPISLIADAARGGSIGFACLGGLAALLVWLVSTLLGRNNAARGECALMRWLGHGAMLPLPVEIPDDPVASAPYPSADDLVHIIRTSPDGLARRLALADLRKLGMVEEL